MQSTPETMIFDSEVDGESRVVGYAVQIPELKSFARAEEAVIEAMWELASSRQTEAGYSEKWWWLSVPKSLKPTSSS